MQCLQLALDCLLSGLLFYCPKAQVVQEQVAGGELLDTATHSGDIDVALAGDERLQNVTGTEGCGIAMMVDCSKEAYCRRLCETVAEGDDSRGAGKNDSYSVQHREINIYWPMNVWNELCTRAGVIFASNNEQ